MSLLPPFNSASSFAQEVATDALAQFRREFAVDPKFDPNVFTRRERGRHFIEQFNNTQPALNREILDYCEEQGLVEPHYQDGQWWGHPFTNQVPAIPLFPDIAGRESRGSVRMKAEAALRVKAAIKASLPTMERFSSAGTDRSR